ncbi:YraN family protein [Dermatobacter hominis]|uniref:YraN family protein n=1 Tax=Dermatobacter hominis TaxID=2884263 RepID=UPI001D11B004|nr:YraN family protein [Dermatobacter hominis]UDY36871.1 YraN family protein [Dermatobacter hominis]
MSDEQPRPRRYDHRRLGEYGEDRAQAWYLARGYLLYDRNWRCPDGELDLVLGLVDGAAHTVVFCEVKTRSTHRFGSPFEAVGRDKQRRLRRLALRWLDAHDVRARHLRFDVVAVTSGRVEVLEDAF